MLLRLIVPVGAVELAAQAPSGVFTHLHLPPLAGVVLGVVALDLWKYLEHRLMHAVSPLWRFHLVHHSDVEVDFTTTERHHPVEAAIAAAGLLAAIYALAIPPLSIALFFLAGTAVSLLSHANLSLPQRVDRALAALIVTPGVHLIHHSPRRRETDSNYGFVFTVWDRLFGTYVGGERAGRSGPRLQGLDVFRETDAQRIDRVLCQPFLYRRNGVGPMPARPHAVDDASP
jgi:sterol desaturase/sphingolipid hydroxylase (fatty acid hydroxylase superfamily)